MTEGSVRQVAQFEGKATINAWEYEDGWLFEVAGAEVFLTHEDADELARTILFKEADDAV